MRTTALTRAGVLTLVGLLAACADSSAPGTRVSDAMLTYDAASDAGVAAALDLSQMSAGEIAAGIPSTTAGASSTACTYSAATGRFTCPTTTTPEGLKLDRSYAYYAGGTAQSAYNATTTDSINFQWALAGALTRPNGTAWVNATRSSTVSGLAGAETQRTWNGTGSRTDSSTVSSDGRTRRTKVVASSVVNQVVFRLPRSTYPYPQSGTITHDATLTAYFEGSKGSSTRTATRHAVVTFNGTRTASLVVGTTNCTLDLQTRAVSCP